MSYSKEQALTIKNSFLKSMDLHGYIISHALLTVSSSITVSDFDLTSSFLACVVTITTYENPMSLRDSMLGQEFIQTFLEIVKHSKD